MMGAVEGNVVGVIVKNAWAGAVDTSLLNFFVIVLSGSQAFANLASMSWAAWSHGRHKVKFVFGLQVATVGLVLMMALAPINALGLLMLVVGVTGTRVCWSGVVMLRSTVWRANYRRINRATVAGKLATIQALVLTVVVFLVAQAMDYDAQSFRFILPLAAVFGLIGAILYRRVRVRGHRMLITSEQDMPPEDRPSFHPLKFGRVLHQDKQYDRFMACQFIFGLGNLMVTGPLVIIIKDLFGMGYAGIHIMATIPFLLMPLSIPLWARLLNRTHIIHFRAIHSWVFVLSTGLVLVSTLTLTPWILFVAAGIKGLAFGGGVLAWNLGHHDFAQKSQASHYMGVHVTLTGIRGIIALLGAWSLYELLERSGTGRGVWIFAVCLGLTVLGALGFIAMGRRMPGNKSGQAIPPLAK